MRNGILLLVLWLGLSATLRAQNTENIHITLQEAIDLALENNYMLKQAANNLDLAESQEFSEKADFLPSLGASMAGFKQIGRQFNNSTGEFGDFTINGVNTSFSVGVPIFSGFENINSLRSSQYDTRSWRESLQRARENVIFQTASAYLQVVLNTELLEIADENLATSEKQLEQVSAQVEVGSRPTVDLYDQEATVANNELAVTNSENALQLSKLQLIRQLQVDPLRNYTFSIPDVEQSQITPTEYNIEQLVSAAMENRSDLRSERYNIEAIRYDLKSTRSILYPTLSLNASLSSSYNDQNFDRTSGELFSFNDQYFDQNINRSIRLSLSIPIFDNFNRRTSVQVQETNYKNALLALENTELQIVQEVNQAYNDYQAIIKQLESTQKALRAAEKSYETQQERYAVGAGTLIELSDVNARYIQAQSDYARTTFNFIFQQKLLDYYIGKLNENISLN